MKKGRLRGYFITGLLVVVPLYITAYVLILIVGFMDSLMGILPTPLRPATYLPVPGTGIIFTLAAIFLVGVFTTNFLGKRLLSTGEKVMARIPFLRGVYNSTKQFLETFLSKDHEGFRKVVLLEFPGKGLWSIGFVTGRATGEIGEKTGTDVVNIFLPTTPNPTTGFYVAVPEKDVIPLEMTAEDAFKIIMTAGIITPPSRNLESTGKLSANK